MNDLNQNDSGKSIPSPTDPGAQHADNLRTVYTELCSSYRAVDDFRTKLLGFLPVATGAGIFFLVTDKEKIDFVHPYFPYVGAFGFVITLGLFFYELYGIKKCTHLIWAGKDIETEMQTGDGQFSRRRPGIAGWINEPFASGVIYPAVLGAWTFIALAFSAYKTAAPWLAISVFAVGFAICLFYNRQLKNEGELREKEAAERLMRERQSA